MKFLKNIFSQLHSFVLCLLLSAIFWGWVFTFVTDTAPAKKVTLYCDVPAVEELSLSEVLEENKPEGIRMIQVRNISYVMMDTESFYSGDIFLIPASEVDGYGENLIPIGQEGEKAYDAATGEGVALEYIQYGNEDYYLFLGGDSIHLDDGKALEVALALLAMK